MKIPDFKQHKAQFIGVACILIVITAAVIGAAFQKSKSQKTISSKKNAVAAPTPTETQVTSTPTPIASASAAAIQVFTNTPSVTITVIITKTAATSLTNTPAPTQTPAPTSTPTPIPDTQPPQTRILYPKNGGELTYKTNGQVCVISEGPLDNVSNWQKIQTRFKFESDDWSSYETMRVYFCRDTLANGAHTLRVQSKDEAGNEEAEQSIAFTVNIEGN